MPNVNSIRIEQENRANHLRRLRLGHADQSIECFQHRLADGDHFQYLPLRAGQFLRLSPLGDVAHQVQYGRSPFIGERDGQLLNHDGGPIAAKQRNFDGPLHHAPLKYVASAFPHDSMQRGRCRVVHRTADELCQVFRFRSHHFYSRWIQIDEAVVRGHGDGVGQELDQRPVAVLAFAQRLFGLFALSNVAQRRHQQIPIANANVLGSCFPVKETSILAHQPVLKDFFPAQTNGFRHDGARFGCDQVDDFPPDNFSPFVAKHFEQLIVRVHDTPVLGDSDSFKRRRREESEAFFTFAQFSRRPVAFAQGDGRDQPHQGRHRKKRLQHENIIPRRCLIRRQPRKVLCGEEAHEQRHQKIGRRRPARTEAQPRP